MGETLSHMNHPKKWQLLWNIGCLPQNLTLRGLVCRDPPSTWNVTRIARLSTSSIWLGVVGQLCTLTFFPRLSSCCWKVQLLLRRIKWILVVYISKIGVLQMASLILHNRTKDRWVNITVNYNNIQSFYNIRFLQKDEKVSFSSLFSFNWCVQLIPELHWEHSWCISKENNHTMSFNSARNREKEVKDINYVTLALLELWFSHIPKNLELFYKGV